MKNLFLITLILSLGVFLYFKNNTSSSSEGSSYKSITPDSVAYKDATPEQNDLAYKNGLTILFHKESIHYKGNLKIDSVQGAGLLYNEKLHKNVPVSTQFAKDISSSMGDSSMAGVVLFIIFLYWGFVVKNNSTRSLVLAAMLIVLSVIELVWLYFGSPKENITLVTFCWIILAIPIVNACLILSFDDIEKIARRISGGMIIALLFVFFYLIIPSSIFFFYFGSAGIIIASLIVWTVNRLTPARKKRIT
ncbi:MAG: hypothetical protein WCT42_00070 [Candidatus Paceibacterota bacterium]